MSATGPLDAGEVFNDLNPTMRDYLDSAKKLSTQHKHFFLGQEHLLSAFLLNGYSVIRKYINQPKWNAKKNVQSLLQKSYPQVKGKVKWRDKDICPSGFCVTPRMQDSWEDAIHLTQFGDPADVRDIHVLIAIFDRPNKPVKWWLESENFSNDDIISFLKEQLEHRGLEAKEYAQSDRASSNDSGGIGGFFSSLFGGGSKKSKDKSAENHEPLVQHNRDDEHNKDDEIEQQHIEKVSDEDTSNVEDTPNKESHENVELQKNEESKVEIKDVAEEETKVSNDRVLRVGDSYTYQESELVSRGMPDEIINEFMRLADEYGPLPDRIFFNNKKVYFENLLYENLTLEDYRNVVADLEERIKAAVARSPFRSSSNVAPTHSLFNRKSPEPVEASQVVDEAPSFSPVSDHVYGESQPAEEVPSFSPVSEQVYGESQPADEAPSFSPVSEHVYGEAQVVDEAPSFNSVSEHVYGESQSADEAPSFSPVSEHVYGESQPAEEVPSFSPVSEQVYGESQPVEEVPSFSPVSEQVYGESQPVEEVPSFSPVSDEPVYMESQPVEEAPSFSPVSDEPVYMESQQPVEEAPSFSPVSDEPVYMESQPVEEAPSFSPVSDEPVYMESQPVEEVSSYTPVSDEPVYMESQPVEEAPSFSPVSDEPVYMESQPVEEVASYTPVSEPVYGESQPVEEAPTYTPVSDEPVYMESQPAEEAPTYTPVSDESVYTESQPVEEVSSYTPVSDEQIVEEIKQEEVQVVTSDSYTKDVISYENSIVENNIKTELEDISEVKYIKGYSPLAIYCKYKKNIDISALLKSSKSLYLTKDIDNLQEGFHWSEMLNFIPVNYVSPTPKVGKVDLDMITVGVFENKS